MATISSGTQFLGLATDYPTLERRSALINSQSQFYRMQDLKFNTSGDALSFVVDKNELVSNQVNISYYKLGIDFGELDFTQGNTYTLLIDRWRFAERKGSSGDERQGRFYHEKPADAIGNQRLSEVEITSNFEFVDFNQDRYFKFDPTTLSPNNTGMGYKGRTKNYAASYLNLGFRLRIDNGVDAPIETDYIGYVQMVAFDGGVNPATVSYRY
jgi:hypothetical protein